MGSYWLCRHIVYLSFSQQMGSYWLCRHIDVTEFHTVNRVMLVVQRHGCNSVSQSKWGHARCVDTGALSFITPGVTLVVQIFDVFSYSKQKWSDWQYRRRCSPVIQRKNVSVQTLVQLKVAVLVQTSVQLAQLFKAKRVGVAQLFKAERVNIGCVGIGVGLGLGLGLEFRYSKQKGTRQWWCLLFTAGSFVSQADCVAMTYVHDYTHRDVRNDASNRTKDTVAASCPLLPSAETCNNNDILCFI